MASVAMVYANASWGGEAIFVKHNIVQSWGTKPVVAEACAEIRHEKASLVRCANATKVGRAQLAPTPLAQGMTIATVAAFANLACVTVRLNGQANHVEYVHAPKIVIFMAVVSPTDNVCAWMAGLVPRAARAALVCALATAGATRKNSHATVGMDGRERIALHPFAPTTVVVMGCAIQSVPATVTLAIWAPPVSYRFVTATVATMVTVYRLRRAKAKGPVNATPGGKAEFAMSLQPQHPRFVKSHKRPQPDSNI